MTVLVATVLSPQAWIPELTLSFILTNRNDKHQEDWSKIQTIEECLRQVTPMLIKTAMAYEKIGPSTGLCGKKSGLYKMHAFVYFREKNYCLIWILVRYAKTDEENYYNHNV